MCILVVSLVVTGTMYTLHRLTSILRRFNGSKACIYGAYLCVLFFMVNGWGCAPHNSNTATSDPPAPPAVKAADRNGINYFLATVKWLQSEQQRRASETSDKKEILASCREILKQTKQSVNDASELPVDFRQAFSRDLACEDEAVNLAELAPDPRDSSSLTGWVLQAIWNYTFEAGDPLGDLKTRANNLMTETHQAMQALDSVSISYGARTDWEAMPRVIDVIPGGHAARMGIKPGDFFFTYNGTKLYNRLPQDLMASAKSEGKTTVQVQFLTPHGIIASNVPAGELMGVHIDTTCAQTPVLVRLDSKFLSSEFTVTVINMSSDTTLDDVVVRYIDVNGNPREQALGHLAAKEAKVLDPSEIKWTIEKGEKIEIEARGFVAREFSTSNLIR